jgi:hypothetical protein
MPNTDKTPMPMRQNVVMPSAFILQQIKTLKWKRKNSKQYIDLC